MNKKILVFPYSSAIPVVATVTGKTITGKIKAEDRYGNRYTVDMK